MRPHPQRELNAAGSILDAVREACAFVAERAEQVRIDAAQLRRYADALPAEQIAGPATDDAVESLGPDPERRAAFVCALDAVNFGSGYFPLLRKLPGHSGYRTVEARLRARFAEHALDAAELASTTAGDCARIFEQPLQGPVGELMERFALAWRELGAHLQERHGGSFLALARSAGPRAERLVRELAGLRSYADVAQYQGRAVPFLKRAQISAADLSRALPGELRFEDLDRLTLFADNLVPHVLRLDGVLVYGAALLERIEREEPIESGSPEEVEIRACGLHAVEQLCARARDTGRPLAPYQLDYWLWLRGGGPSYKARPRHRARSWFY